MNLQKSAEGREPVTGWRAAASLDFVRLPLLLSGALLFAAQAKTEDLAIQIPPVTASLDVKGQAVKITAWGAISSPSPGVYTFALTADLGDVEQNITALLASQLNRSERCGERLSVEHATLAPAAPSAILAANVRYERFACIRAFGKETAKRLVGGNAAITASLTPSISTDGIAVAAAVQKIDADGALGELLRSGSLGTAIKEKIASGVQSAIRKGLDVKTSLPPAAADAATMQSVRFQTSADGQLQVSVRGEVHLTAGQFQSLARQPTPRLK